MLTGPKDEKGELMAWYDKRIKELEAEVEKLREALRKIIAYGNTNFEYHRGRMTATAKAALEGKEGG